MQKEEPEVEMDPVMAANVAKCMAKLQIMRQEQEKAQSSINNVVEIPWSPPCRFKMM